MSTPLLKRLIAAAVLVTVGLVLGGCSRCGWIFDEWGKPKSCHSDTAPR